jgi:hypothetical protein
MGHIFLRLGIGLLVCGGWAVAPASGSVRVTDEVTTVGTPVFLRVLTKKGVFSAGGERFTLTVDGESVGRGLTGGDGYGRLRFTPGTAGLKTVTARSGADTASGLLLVVERDRKAVLVELKTLLTVDRRLPPDAEAACAALRRLAGHYRLVYVADVWRRQIASKWLAYHRCPETIVLGGSGRADFEALAERGVRLHALVGSPETIEEAGDLYETCFSFQALPGAQVIENWEDLAEALAP